MGTTDALVVMSGQFKDYKAKTEKLVEALREIVASSKAEFHDEDCRLRSDGWDKDNPDVYYCNCGYWAGEFPQLIITVKQSLKEWGGE